MSQRDRKRYVWMFEALHIGRLVVQCKLCGAIQRWRELAELYRLGWRFRLGLGRLVWTCPEHAAGVA